MNFQITTEAKQLILNHGSQLMLEIEREECYACCGHVNMPSLSAKLEVPKESELNEYELLSEDDVTVYVHKEFYNIDKSATLAIDLDSINETLVIYGIVPER